MVNMTEVCANNRGLVFTIAKKYLPVCERDRAVSLDDLAQAGYIGLIEAAQTYDEAKGAFSTWAGIYIRKEMLEALGLHSLKPKADKDALSLDAEIGEDITLSDTITAPDDTEGIIDRAELARVVRGSVSALPAPQSTLVQLHDLQGRSLATAGHHCGLSLSAARKAYAKATLTLRRNRVLRALASAHHLDQLTDWHRHIGLEAYRSTWTSSTEALAFWRQEHRDRGTL